ncbi:hypothetical protein [uncultured Maribacter sp.]|uniref:hypothetical protein n=1 Tax=uncultured Maribacter sp. TaxID=431308 RepID=UPI002637FE55|nr:hypothetical protein [uncultured Maribacter sp.]
MPSLFLKRLKENPEYFEFWQDFHAYCRDFDIPDKKEFIELLPLISNRIKNDIASYSIYESLRKYTCKKPEDAIEILHMIEEEGNPGIFEFNTAIFGGLSESKTDYPYQDKILSLINSSSEDETHLGISAAYQVVIKDPKEELIFLNKIQDSIKNVAERNSKKSLGIITRFYNKYLNKIDGAKGIIIKLLSLKNIDVQNEVARSINEEFKLDEDKDYFQNCLNLLTYTDAKYKGIYSTIQYRLKSITVSHPDVIEEFINNWINNNNLKGISVLEGIVQELYFNHPKVIEKLFLDWLNSDNNLYKFALPFVISNLSSKVDSIGLDKESLKDFSDVDSVYIVYMIVGHILDRKYASEMLFSILEVKYNSERVRNHIATLFVKYLIINYYSVTEILKKKRKSANKVIKSVIDQIIDASEQYYQQVSDLELVNEFEPSDKRMQYFLKQQNVQIQKLMDTSENKRDSFLDMLTNVNLRAGKSFFSKHKGEYSQESEMQSFRSSFEVARVQSIDEIGQEKLRLMWQNMKRDELSN